MKAQGGAFMVRGNQNTWKESILVDSRDSTRNQKFAPIFERLFKIPPLDLTKRLSNRTLIGLPLIWAAAYFVPALGPTREYLAPSYDSVNLIVIPSLIAVIAGALLLSVVSAARRWVTPPIAVLTTIFGLAGFGVIAVKVLVGASGYTWQDLIPLTGNVPLKLRLCKYGTALGIGVLIWATRGSLPRWSRLLSGLGFAFLGLAAVRLISMWVTPVPVPALLTESMLAQFPHPNSPSVDSPSVAEAHSRRVVWLIFDETDFWRLYGTEPVAQTGLTNFARLAKMAVFATNANSPASATLYSIPSLLAGVPIGGTGIRIGTSASIFLQRTDGTFLPFGEATSIFGALAKRKLTASVLGFYQPYCKIFVLQLCNSFPWPRVGGLDAALWANVPDSLTTENWTPGYFGQVTESLIELLPTYLERDDALTFVHLNIPHLPAMYADKILGLPDSGEPLVEYSRNLTVADKILGEIIQILQTQGAKHETVLIVSTDHWLRKSSYRDPGKEGSRPIPFIVWKVGESKGVIVSHPISTVHTGSMILDYLDGRLSTQSDFAQWWDGQIVYPSYIAPSK